MLERPIVWVVKAYQILVRPWLGAHCRFEPTCSEYMIEALETHGAVRGTWLGLRRIGRCHPWGKSGYDPVPGTSTDSPHIHDRHG